MNESRIMPSLEPGIHLPQRGVWMVGLNPAMTKTSVGRSYWDLVLNPGPALLVPAQFRAPQSIRPGKAQLRRQRLGDSSAVQAASFPRRELERTPAAAQLQSADQAAGP